MNAQSRINDADIVIFCTDMKLQELFITLSNS